MMCGSCMRVHAVRSAVLCMQPARRWCGGIGRLCGGQRWGQRGGAGVVRSRMGTVAGCGGRPAPCLPRQILLRASSRAGGATRRGAAVGCSYALRASVVECPPSSRLAVVLLLVRRRGVGGTGSGELQHNSCTAVRYELVVGLGQSHRHRIILTITLIVIPYIHTIKL